MLTCWRNLRFIWRYDLLQVINQLRMEAQETLVTYDKFITQADKKTGGRLAANQSLDLWHRVAQLETQLAKHKLLIGLLCDESEKRNAAVSELRKAVDETPSG